jgi:hypothetical protein
MNGSCGTILIIVRRETAIRYSEDFAPSGVFWCNPKARGPYTLSGRRELPVKCGMIILDLLGLGTRKPTS